MINIQSYSEKGNVSNTIKMAVETGPGNSANPNPTKGCTAPSLG